MRCISVECLRCGRRRAADATRSHRVDPGDCPHCGYVGWAPSGALSETARRLIRERPPEQRFRLYAA